MTTVAKAIACGKLATDSVSHERDLAVYRSRRKIISSMAAFTNPGDVLKWRNRC